MWNLVGTLIGGCILFGAYRFGYYNGSNDAYYDCSSQLNELTNDLRSKYPEAFEKAEEP